MSNCPIHSSPKRSLRFLSSRAACLLLAGLLVSTGCKNLERSELLAPEENSGTIRGQVTLDGEPLAGSTLIFRSGEDLISVRTDEAGSYEITLLRGEWDIWVGNVPGAACPSSTVRLHIGEEKNLALDCRSLEGTYDVEYRLSASTCEASLAPYTVEATAQGQTIGENTQLSFQFPDAPAPISGLYYGLTETYAGETPFVDIGNGLTARESWDTAVDFQLGAQFYLTGTATVEVRAGGAPVCQRDFLVQARRMTFTF